LPPSVLTAIEAHQRLEGVSGSERYYVLLSNEDALKAAAQAAQQRGFITEIADAISDGPIEQGGELLFKRLRDLRGQHDDPAATVCLISGGEFGCPVKGAGIGGRNLETALRLASSMSAMPNTVGLCAGTDGIDGNSPAAGAIVDVTTLARAKSLGIDADDFLNRSDAYSFFVALGDAITTGPTGTNVRDLRILLTSTDR
jgi:glycerate-2-kinase